MWHNAGKVGMLHEWGGRKCFHCQQKRHLDANCPNDAMFCSERRMDYKGNSAVRKVPAVFIQGLHIAGKVDGIPVEPVILDTVDGIPVEPVILDTGCSRTLVRSDLVSQNNQLEGGHNIHVEAAVSDTVCQCQYYWEQMFLNSRVSLGRP